MPVVEALSNYWDIPIHDSELFSEIRTPDWSSRAATIKTKRWLAAHAFGYDDPQEIPRDIVNLIPNFGESHARQGKLKSTGEWTTQSILIPKDLVTREEAGRIACYITESIDKQKPAVC